MHYFLLIYFINKPLHISSSLAAHHQEDQLCHKQQSSSGGSTVSQTAIIIRRINCVTNSNWYNPVLCWLTVGRIHSNPANRQSA